MGGIWECALVKTVNPVIGGTGSFRCAPRCVMCLVLSAESVCDISPSTRHLGIDDFFCVLCIVGSWIASFASSKIGQMSAAPLPQLWQPQRPPKHGPESPMFENHWIQNGRKAPGQTGPACCLPGSARTSRLFRVAAGRGWGWHTWGLVTSIGTKRRSRESWRLKAH